MIAALIVAVIVAVLALWDATDRHAEVRALRQERDEVKGVAIEALRLADRGDYRNGVTDSTGMLDEGDVRTAQSIGTLYRRLQQPPA